MKTTIALTIALVLAASPAFAQVREATPPSPVFVPLVPLTKAEDVKSIDAIITALYDVISGPAGQTRDWNRMRALFVPGGKLMPTRPQIGGKGTAVRFLEVNDYIALVGPQLEKGGFTEREIARKVEEFGPITHVWSTYEGKMAADTTITRGINSIQLLNDGARWWVINVYWAAETKDRPLPDRYLKSDPR